MSKHKSPVAGPLALKFQHPKIEYLPIEKLRPAKRNPRTHNKKQTEKLYAIIRQFGFINPIIIADDGTIIAGHLRFQVAKLMHLAEVPVIRIQHLTDAEKRAFALAENRIAQDAGTDPQLLHAEILELAVELPKESIDIAVTGYEISEIDTALMNFEEPIQNTAADELPAPGPRVSKPGDLWLMGEHRLSQTDARDSTAYEALMRGERATMTITDPPYNVSILSHARGRSRKRFSEFAMGSGEFNDTEYIKFLTQCLGCIVQVSKDGAIVYVFIDWSHVHHLLEAGTDVFSELKNICTWVKSNGGQGSFYRSQHELVCVFKNGTAPHINTFELGQHGRTRTNVWRYAGVNSFKAGRHDELNMHPTVKPVRMIVDAMLDCSSRGSVVLDPFMGSGSSLIAGESVGRRVYGMELDSEYVDVAIRRWQRFTGRDAILESTGQTFAEIQSARAPVPAI